MPVAPALALLAASDAVPQAGALAVCSTQAPAGQEWAAWSVAGAATLGGHAWSDENPARLAVEIAQLVVAAGAVPGE